MVGKSFDLLREDSESDVYLLQEHTKFQKGVHFSTPLRTPPPGPAPWLPLWAPPPSWGVI